MLLVIDSKIKIMQQVLDPTGTGGVSAEFRALENSSLKNKFNFISLVLKNYHKGINIKDIWFYYKKIREVKPDIIQIRGAAIDGLNAIIAAKMVRETRIMVCVHGMYSDLVYINEYKRWICKFLIEPMIFKLSDGISCVYENAAERNVFAGYSSKMLPFVYNRMPDYSKYNKTEIKSQILKEYHIDKSQVVGIYCGRITKEKGMHILLQALVNLDTNWPSLFTLFIVGDGPYLLEFKEKVSKLQNKNKIYCVGSRDDVYRYLLTSDFFIQPSLHENHSIALLEACAAKLPSIVTNVGGNSEIITDEIDGILIAKENVDELFNAINRMINDKEFYINCINNITKNKFQRFSDIEVDRQLENAYLKMLERSVNI